MSFGLEATLWVFGPTFECFLFDWYPRILIRFQWLIWNYVNLEFREVHVYFSADFALLSVNIRNL